MIYFWFDKYQEKRASHRLRASLLVNELTMQGIDSGIVNQSNIDNINKDSIIIFSKDSLFENMITVKQKGFTVGFDLCDNKFLEERENYLNYCNSVDFITVNSKVMQEVVFDETGRESYYFADVVERTIQEPSIPLNKQLNLLWYGGSSSRAYMPWKEIIEMFEDNNIDYKLNVCSNKIEKWKSKNVSRILKNSEEAWDDSNIIYHEWSYELQDRLMNECDIILIPVHDYSDKAKRRTVTKSHNRLTDGIAKGKWVISTPLESYKPLKDFCWLEDILEGISFYQNNSDTVKQKILNGQQWIKDNASAQVVSTQLLKIYESVKK